MLARRSTVFSWKSGNSRVKKPSWSGKFSKRIPGGTSELRRLTLRWYKPLLIDLHSAMWISNVLPHSLYLRALIMYFTATCQVLILVVSIVKYWSVLFILQGLIYTLYSLHHIVCCMEFSHVILEKQLQARHFKNQLDVCTKKVRCRSSSFRGEISLFWLSVFELVKKPP